MFKHLLAKPWPSLLLFALAPGFLGCESFGPWVKAHGDAGAWGRAASPLNPNHSGSLALLATVPYFVVNDDRLSDSLRRNQPLGGKTSQHNGDILQAVLAFSPVVPIGISSFVPDRDGEALEVLEVALESLALNAGLTQLLKVTTDRERPEGASTKSFPSGHVSNAMTGATVTARWLRSKSLWFLPVELGLYGGVGYVAVSRMENSKHFPTDTIAGAILGGYIANTMWDAHFGRDEEDGIFNHLRRHVVPAPVGEGLGLFYATSF